MRALIALVVVIYLVGVGVALSPTIQAQWNSASASQLTTSVAQAKRSRVAGEGLSRHNEPRLIRSPARSVGRI